VELEKLVGNLSREVLGTRRELDDQVVDRSEPIERFVCH
jgi:hypothetical protein